MLDLRQPQRSFAPKLFCDSVTTFSLFNTKISVATNYRAICRVYVFSEYAVAYGSSYFFDVFAPYKQKGNNISGNALKVLRLLKSNCLTRVSGQASLRRAETE